MQARTLLPGLPQVDEKLLSAARAGLFQNMLLGGMMSDMIQVGRQAGWAGRPGGWVGGWVGGWAGGWVAGWLGGWPGMCACVTGWSNGWE